MTSVVPCDNPLAYGAHRFWDLPVDLPLVAWSRQIGESLLVFYIDLSFPCSSPTYLWFQSWGGEEDR